MIAAALMLAAVAPDASGQLIIDRNRIDRAPMPETRPRERPEKIDRAAVGIASQGSGIAIRRIEFLGQSVPARVARAANRFIGQDASADTLRALAAALAKAYAKTDVALYSIAIPEQDFANGTLIVSITEGYVAAAALEGAAGAKGSGRHKRARHHLESLIGERPLTRRRFERQISLMRDIPGFSLESIVSAGGEDGAVALSAKPRQKRSLISFGFNNRGTRALGDAQFEATGKVYGALAEGDQLSVTAAAASDLKKYVYAGAGYSALIGHDGLSIGLTAAYLKTRPNNTPLRGEARALGLTLSYPLIRAFDENLYVTASLDGLNSDNAAFGNVIAAERTRAARLALRYAKATPTRSVSGGVSLSKGLDILGARADRTLTELPFAKANLDLTLSQKLIERVYARATAGGQFSKDRLPAAERFAIGGESYGRAFESAVLSADRGTGGSIELAWQPQLGKAIEGSEVYLFADRAAVRLNARAGLAGQGFNLASAGVGTRLKYREKAEIGLEAAAVIDHPFAMQGDDWRMLVDWRLAF